MEYLNIFEAETNYNSVSPTMTLPGVSLITEGNKVRYNPIFRFNPRYLYSDLSTSKTLDDNKRVIGIEVVPAHHTPNRKARFMSIKNMSYTNPETGTITVGNISSNTGCGIPWGTSDETPGYIAYPKPLDLETGGLSSTGEGSFIPADTNENLGIINYPYEPEGRYWGGGDISKLLAYPYNREGKRNSLFVQAGTWTEGKMDGKTNTKNLILKLSGDAWKTGDINLNLDETNFPAAISCYRFNAGVSELSGKWYLPSADELAYLWANIGIINTKLSAIKVADEAVCVGMGLSTVYPYYGDTTGLGATILSSTTSDNSHFWWLSAFGEMSNGAAKNGTDNSTRVRAFIEI